MKNHVSILLAAWAMLCAQQAFAGDEFSYAAIAARHAETRLSATELADAKMQGECLVGLKRLNFMKREAFDPVAEWTNYRSLSLLEQFPPCTVLVMIEVAREQLLAEDAE